MLAKITSCALVGLEGVLVDVEVDVHPGEMGRIDIVGLPDAAIQESRQRVRSAIFNSRLSFPSRPVTINLAPADLHKEGPAYDLPIAVGILAGQRPPPVDGDQMFIGELAGRQRAPREWYPLHGPVAREQGITRCTSLPPTPRRPPIPGMTIYAVESLGQLAMHSTTWC